LARCPFSKEAFSVKDGRQADLTNSAFGAVYGVIDGEAYPVCDDAGYAPFGFGYRRCPGELLTVDFVKDLLRKVWAETTAQPALMASGRPLGKRSFRSSSRRMSRRRWRSGTGHVRVDKGRAA
jgi:hypothetical protein